MHALSKVCSEELAPLAQFSNVAQNESGTDTHPRVNCAHNAFQPSRNSTSSTEKMAPRARILGPLTPGGLAGVGGPEGPRVLERFAPCYGRYANVPGQRCHARHRDQVSNRPGDPPPPPGLLARHGSDQNTDQSNTHNKNTLKAESCNF